MSTKYEAGSDKTPSGDICGWCLGKDIDPFDADDAHAILCLTHFAEWMGESVESLGRMEAAQRADMTALGFFDR